MISVLVVSRNQKEKVNCKTQAGTEKDEGDMASATKHRADNELPEKCRAGPGTFVRRMSCITCFEDFHLRLACFEVANRFDANRLGCKIPDLFAGPYAVSFHLCQVCKTTPAI